MEDYPASPADNGPIVGPPSIPWIMGELVGAKPPNRPSQFWTIRTKLQIEGKKRDSAPRVSRLGLHGVASIGLDPAKFGTHSLRGTKAALIYRRTGNLRAVEHLLGHSKLRAPCVTLV